MSLRALIFGFATAMLAQTALAEPSCTPTTTLSAPNYPGARVIPSTNNLLLPTGKAVEANAQRLIISGRVVDRRCIPVQEAVVELWQMNPFGKWYLAERDELASADPVFAGAGRTITDGDGNFTFITGFPGVGSSMAKGKGKNAKAYSVPRAPQVNIRIKARGFDTFTTVLFFDRDKRNATDPVYKKLSAGAKASVTLDMSQSSENEIVGTTEIVLPGKVPYQTY